MALRNDYAPDVSRFLVRFGADPSLRNENGETAMDLGGPVIRAVIAPSLLARWFSSLSRSNNLYGLLFRLPQQL